MCRWRNQCFTVLGGASSQDEITSPILDFWDPQLFQEIFNQTSEVTSASNCSSYVEKNNRNNFSDKSSSRQDHEEHNYNTDLSIIFDSKNEITASIDFSSSIQFQDQFDFTGIQLLPPAFKEDCLSFVPSYSLGSINPSSPCSFLGDTAYMNMVNNGLGTGFYAGSIIGSDFKPLQDQLMEIQADNGGMVCPDPIKPEDPHLQGLDTGKNQNQMVVPPVLPQLGTEISGLDDLSFSKVAKLSAEQRKEKIHRYMKKRNERNFSKKIKYSCRKTLADSRPRVRGRFAKNDEFCEPNRPTSSSHFQEDNDDYASVKEEDNFSDIFSHISGLNSFNCNYPIQSWI